LHDLVARDFLSEAVVLSTCHRIEVYVVAERFHGAMADVRHFLSELSYVPPEDFSDHLYVHYDEAAAAHLFAVTAGLDSVVVGETQILGQVRDAWERARQEEAAGARLSLLFRQALEVGKRARTETAIARGITSLSQAAVAMATERLSGLTGRNVVVLGAGEMGAGLVDEVAEAAVPGSRVTVANRTWARAEQLAERAGVWVNGADDPANCSFTLPSVVRRGDLQVTVSTGGRSPALATWLRRRLEGEIGPEYAVLLDLLATERDGLKAAGVSTEGLDWRSALDSDMLDLIRTGDLAHARERLQTCLSSSSD
jgi:glutamyl-tRNA reductase